MFAQVIGNLNGLPHEFKYIEEPGNVVKYTPSLPDGAHTDDDTDIEWVYLREIARSGKTLVPPQRIVQVPDDDRDLKLFALSFTAFFVCFYTFLA